MGSGNRYHGNLRSTDVLSLTNVLFGTIEWGKGFEEKKDVGSALSGKPDVTVTQKKVDQQKLATLKQKTKVPVDKKKQGEAVGVKSSAFVATPKVEKKMRTSKKGKTKNDKASNANDTVLSEGVIISVVKSQTLNVVSKVALARDLAANPGKITAEMLKENKVLHTLASDIDYLLLDSEATYNELLKLDDNGSEAGKFKKDLQAVADRIVSLQTASITTNATGHLEAGTFGSFVGNFMRGNTLGDVALSKLTLYMDPKLTGSVLDDVATFIKSDESKGVREKLSAYYSPEELKRRSGPSESTVSENIPQLELTYAAILPEGEAKRLNAEEIKPITKGPDKGKVSCQINTVLGNLIPDNEKKSFETYFTKLVNKMVDPKNFEQTLLKAWGDRYRNIENAIKSLPIDSVQTKGNRMSQKELAEKASQLAYSTIVNDLCLRYLSPILCTSKMDVNAAKLFQFMGSSASNMMGADDKDLKEGFVQFALNYKPSFVPFADLILNVREKYTAFVQECLKQADMAK